MSRTTRAVERRLQTEHADVLESIDRCAELVVDSWERDHVTEGRAVAEPFRQTLVQSGVLSQLPAVLTDLVEAMGDELRARPVAAPPYVVVTSRGPILRATIEPGRLVVRFDAFEVVREPELAYRRLESVRASASLVR